MHATENSRTLAEYGGKHQKFIFDWDFTATIGWSIVENAT